MSSVSENITSPIYNDEDLQNCSMSELIASLTLALDHTYFEKVQEAMDALERKCVKVEQQNESLKNALERLKSQKSRLEDELRKCRRTRRDTPVGTERGRFAEDVSDVRRGGGETSSKDIMYEVKWMTEALKHRERQEENWIRVQKMKYKMLSTVEERFNAEKTRSNVFRVAEKGN